MIRLGVNYADDATQRAITERVAELATRSKLGAVTKYQLASHDAWVAGDRGKVLAEIDKGTHADHVVHLMFARGLDLTIMKGDESGWTVGSDSLDHGAELLAMAVALAETAFADPDHPPERVAIVRNDDPDFVPKPPVAKAYMAVTTTDREVDQSFEAADVFWRQWRVVERADGRKLCLRATDKLDSLAWLGATYEGTLAMMRAAKPGKTVYGAMTRWQDRYRAFWAMGSFDEECAGMPALRRVGYDKKTKTLEYTGMVAKDDDERAHVMMKELGELANIVDDKKDDEGRAIAHVRVVFPEAWMAQQEKRPLLDLGIEVYFTGKRGELVAVED